MDQLEMQSSPSTNTNSIRDSVLKNQLLTRRERLRTILPSDERHEAGPNVGRLRELLREVDSALERMQAGTFGICETCHDAIENDRLLVDPLCRNCIDHLSPAEQRALERDLDLAFQVQRGLLPKPGVAGHGWTLAYHYEPAGPVSGDYCDWIAGADGDSHFFVGDVTGKGVAASMLMAQLHAIFRSLAATTPSPCQLLTKANRIFCEGTLSSYFATVVGGRVGADGEVEISNAGHCLPMHIGARGKSASAAPITSIQSTGLPLGIFCDTEYSSQTLTLEKGDSLVLYSDGLTEAFNPSREQYGSQRLSSLLQQQAELAPQELLAATLEDLKSFRAGAPRSDDLTIMIIRREE
ncbi:MAG TPA: SpoIIE family protein phosphatase [Gemmataceae bacterium]|jgi:sigma-B regulation protein RsbU (phosphoserine phosphatase)|nr:SpoIIE family protein phosphatase [Gemmataceae bacterium]